jgi:hypothetical protein
MRSAMAEMEEAQRDYADALNALVEQQTTHEAETSVTMQVLTQCPTLVSDNFSIQYFIAVSGIFLVAERPVPDAGLRNFPTHISGIFQYIDILRGDARLYLPPQLHCLPFFSFARSLSLSPTLPPTHHPGV